MLRNCRPHWRVALKSMRSFLAVFALEIAPALVAQSSAAIGDPCFAGYFNFHHEMRTDGFYRNAPREPDSNPPIEYDFSKSPLLKVPGD
jgi:hypothetical protein